MRTTITLPLETLTRILVKLDKAKKRVKTLVEECNQGRHNLTVLRENYDTMCKQNNALYTENEKFKKEAGTYPDRIRILADEKREVQAKLLKAMDDNTSLRRSNAKTWEDTKAAQHLLYKVADLIHQEVAIGDEYTHKLAIQKLLSYYAPDKLKSPADVATQDAPKVEEKDE